MQSQDKTRRCPQFARVPGYGACWSANVPAYPAGPVLVCAPLSGSVQGALAFAAAPDHEVPVPVSNTYTEPA